VNQPVIDMLLPAALGFIMLSLGLSLTPRDFLRVFAHPRAVLVGLFGQIVLVPVLAFAIVNLAGLPADLALGLMILAACPGGVSSGLITHLAGGETALSISLTALSSVAAVLSVPLVIEFAMRHFTGAGVAVELPMAKLVRGVFFLTTLPVAMGMLLRHLQPLRVARWEAGAARLATSLFVLIVIATFVSQHQALSSHLASIGPVALALNLSVMAGGFGLAALAGLKWRDRIAITSECGLQNAALGIYIAASVLHAPGMTIASVIYALLMNLSAIAFIFLMRQRGAVAPVI